ncbi:hypothetical protein [Streptomyces sp. NPDC000851]
MSGRPGWGADGVSAPQHNEFGVVLGGPLRGQADGGEVAAGVALFAVPVDASRVDAGERQPYRAIQPAASVRCSDQGRGRHAGAAR